MFSPTRFHDFYSGNRWEINNIYVVPMTPRQETEPFFYTEYEPGNFDAVSYGGLGAASLTHGRECAIMPGPVGAPVERRNISGSSGA